MLIEAMATLKIIIQIHITPTQRPLNKRVIGHK